MQVEAESLDGPDVQVAQIGVKEGFGEMALLTDQPRFATVVALTDLEVWRLPKDAFQALLAENRTLAAYFSELLNHRLDTLEETVYASY